jgi:dTDP-4-dehydrorhamnose reductase
MPKVLVFGGTGMLGAMVVDVLAGTGLPVTATARGDSHAALTARYPNVEWRSFDAEQCESHAAAEFCRGFDYAINAIGITKPLIRDDQPAEVERAIRVNGLFPHWLGRAGVPVLQIATDCVYSGASSRYTETSLHDATDVYGKSKSVGESWQPSVHHLRCSIIGPEPRDKKFLLEWFLKQPPGGEVSGFTNHDWNGVTTLHFARVCVGIIQAKQTLGHLQHIVPAAPVSKFELLKLFAQSYGGSNVRIKPTEAGHKVDRTLGTVQPELNALLWSLAGYAAPPSIETMVAEMAAYRPQFTA